MFSNSPAQGDQHEDGINVESVVECQTGDGIVMTTALLGVRNANDDSEDDRLLDPNDSIRCMFSGRSYAVAVCMGELRGSPLCPIHVSQPLRRLHGVLKSFAGTSTLRALATMVFLSDAASAKALDHCLDTATVLVSLGTRVGIWDAPFIRSGLGCSSGP